MAGKLKRDATEYLPPTKSLPALRKAVDQCRGCDLYRCATQAVFGEGAKAARLMLIGEQPGNEEDKQGRPFVGPAGHLLDKALIEAGIDRGQVYVTNVVKHFKFEERGRSPGLQPLARSRGLPNPTQSDRVFGRDRGAGDSREGLPGYPRPRQVHQASLGAQPHLNRPSVVDSARTG